MSSPGRRARAEDHGPWVNDANAALLTDLYELTMLQAYHRERMSGEAVFDLFFRRLPECRNFLIAAGLDDVLRYLEHLSFDDEAIRYLKSTERFDDDFLAWLREFRFTGDVLAVPEGTPMFANEPLVQVIAPIAEAQLIETYLLNQVQFQTMLASKAARIVLAANGCAIVDFGLRRMHGTDAGVKAARSFHIAGVSATSNILAGKLYDIPISGTMAHSYIEAHDDELAAFRAFAKIFPETVLLVDTYDTLDGVRKVIELARELGDDFRVKAVRLDSGDLGRLAKDTRRLLDEAGLQEVGIFASGGLDEMIIRDLLAGGAPIDGFGVGSAMGVSADAPVLDSAYKLSHYAGLDRMKLSEEKSNLPGRKQIYRVNEGSEQMHDVIARDDESIDGRPLLVPVMQRGKRLDAGRESLDEMRQRAADAIESLPARLRSLEPADPPYEVRLSAAMAAHRDAIRGRLRSTQRAQVAEDARRSGNA